jgi:type IV pilus assembly PilN-like protein
MRDFSSRPRRRPPQPVDLGLIGIGVLTLIFAGYATGTSWADFKRARQHVADVRRDTEAAQARLKTMEARSAPTAALATQALLSTDAAPPRVLAELAALMPPDLKLDSLSLSYGEGIGMSMHVSAKNAGAYEAFLQRLEASPLFEEVVPGEEARDGGVAASIEMRYRGGAR